MQRAAYGSTSTRPASVHSVQCTRCSPSAAIPSYLAPSPTCNICGRRAVSYSNVISSTASILRRVSILPFIFSQYTLCPSRCSRERSVSLDACGEWGPHEALHNLYGVLESKASALYFIRKLRQRSFVLSRSAWLGLGFWGAHWHALFPVLTLLLLVNVCCFLLGAGTIIRTGPRLLQMSLAGISLGGSDVCGTELCIRPVIAFIVFHSNAFPFRFYLSDSFRKYTFHFPRDVSDTPCTSHSSAIFSRAESARHGVCLASSSLFAAPVSLFAEANAHLYARPVWWTALLCLSRPCCRRGIRRDSLSVRRRPCLILFFDALRMAIIVLLFQRYWFRTERFVPMTSYSSNRWMNLPAPRIGLLFLFAFPVSSRIFCFHPYQESFLCWCEQAASFQCSSRCGQQQRRTALL